MCVQANKEFVVEHVFHARLDVCVRVSSFRGCKRENVRKSVCACREAYIIHISPGARRKKQHCTEVWALRASMHYTADRCKKLKPKINEMCYKSNALKGEILV